MTTILLYTVACTSHVLQLFGLLLIELMLILLMLLIFGGRLVLSDWLLHQLLAYLLLLEVVFLAALHLLLSSGNLGKQLVKRRLVGGHVLWPQGGIRRLFIDQHGFFVIFHLCNIILLKVTHGIRHRLLLLLLVEHIFVDWFLLGNCC